LVRVGIKYEYVDKNGRVHVGRVVRIARMRTGAVLAFMEDGKGYPVSKHGTWREINESDRY